MKNWLKTDHSLEHSLVVEWNKSKAAYEKKYLDNKNLIGKKVPLANAHNYIIKYFQQDTFYKKEKQLFRDDVLKQKLLNNRCKFLNKSESQLTALEILDGFKKAGIHYGYSHFNPLVFKWFILNNNIKTCYDPCGGWGHRLLGSSDLDLYVYNDLSLSTKQNVDKIIKYFKITNTVTYCEDASEFVPKENFEAMFTCPPYFNLEHYECGDFKDLNCFHKFIDSLFNVFNGKSSCKIFGLVMREDMLFSHNDYVEKHLLTVDKKNYLPDTKKANNEFLFVYKK